MDYSVPELNWIGSAVSSVRKDGVCLHNLSNPAGISVRQDEGIVIAESSPHDRNSSSAAFSIRSCTSEEHPHQLIKAYICLVCSRVPTDIGLLCCPNDKLPSYGSINTISFSKEMTATDKKNP